MECWAERCTSRIHTCDPIEPGLNRCNIFVDFLGGEAVMATTSFNSDGEPLTVHQHCLEGPAVVEPDIRIDNLLDGTRHCQATIPRTRDCSVRDSRLCEV